MKKLDFCADFDLLDAIRVGEARAYNLVHQAYYTPLIGYAYNMVFSEEAAEDIVAEAFCRLFISREEIQSLPHIRRFLFMITRNLAVDWVRARRVRRRMIGADLVDLSGEVVESIDEYTLAAPELLRHIINEVENLPEKSREVFKLYFYAEMTTAEISALLKIHPQTVLNHKSIAVKCLKSRLVLSRLMASS